MAIFSSSPAFIWSANSDGLAIRFSDRRRYEKARENRAKETDQLAFIRMQMLAESGESDVRVLDSGIFIAAEDAVRLDEKTRESFELPGGWPGGMRLRTESVPQLSNFNLKIALVDADGIAFWHWRLRGPILEVGGEAYLPQAAQFAALKAYTNWSETENRDETDHLSLLATLRQAWKAGCPIDLETYRETVIANADELSLDAREENGDLILRPVVSGDFPEIDPDQIEKRIGQLGLGGERTVLRVGKTIVLLTPAQTRQARAVAKQGRVPREQRKAFEKNPSAWLSEHVFPDLEIEFSPRVTGIGAWSPGYLGANWEAGEDWFGKKPEPEKKTQKPAEEDKEGAAVSEQDTPDPEEDKPKPLVPLIIPNDEELGFGWRFTQISSEAEQRYQPDFSRYTRFPYPHQEAAIRWLLGHARRALGGKPSKGGAGALLADDMGLGKTLSTLVFLAEWLDLWRKRRNEEPPAVLIVAPLSLLENWKTEIQATYPSDHSVFNRLLLAQADADLDKVRRGPGARDRVLPGVPGEVQAYGLGFGDQSERSMDAPGGCVLTTYQTLREYRFSFAKAEWSAVILDETQHIKNPNALQTIAAKSLKSLFWIALTGTPVENHLGDFWCILDTIEPGKMGSFADFRRNWIRRMSREPDRKKEIGEALRQKVGGLMLRRTKEESLEGLPKKNIKKVRVEMSPEQTRAYDSVINAVTGEREQAEDEIKKRNRQLAYLWELRHVSLHPDLLGGGDIPAAKRAKDSRKVLGRSGKLNWLLECLDRIRKQEEKALIFCVQKKLQEALALHLGKIYDIFVPVINGDTKATSRNAPEKTRHGLIQRFSDQPGFSVCVLSPIATGAGLNIQAANHVIHMERHWNPAKEDQATDRVYRIGQAREVFVYLPLGIHPRHPEIKSFDYLLCGLLEKKRGLQSALGLVPPESVTGPDIINEVFGIQQTEEKQSDRIDLEGALNLSWQLFEALIAVIYKQEAQKVILTSASSDHGCDVVVMGWGKNGDNLLIQCKTTSKKILHSEKAIREIESSRRYYENKLDEKFNRRILHTTAKNWSLKTREAAKLYNVSVYGRSWLKDRLKKTPIERSKVLAADTERRSV